MTRAATTRPSPARDSSGTDGSASTMTVSSSIRPGRVSTHWKYGESPGTPRTISSIWVGKTLTPRTIIMSSVRPVTFSIRRNPGRAVPGSSRVRSRVR